MAYEIGTIGDLFSGQPFPLPPLDPSWLPPDTIQRPDGRLEPAPPAPSRPFDPLRAATDHPVAVLAGVGALALILVLVARR